MTVELLRAWVCTRCGHTEQQPRSVREVWHECRVLRRLARLTPEPEEEDR